MRKVIGKPVFIRQGKTVRITCRLTDPKCDARLQLFSGVTSKELSPHIPEEWVDIKDKEGMPQMHRPFSMRLSSHRKERVLQFVAERDFFFQVKQDVDPDEKLARVVIRGYSDWYLRLEAWLVKRGIIKPKEDSDAQQASA